MDKTGSHVGEVATLADLARGDPDHLDLARAIAAGARRFGGVEVSFSGSDGIVETSLSELYEDAQRVAAGLAAEGFRPGDVLVGQLPHSREAMTTFLACVIRGIVFVPVVHILGPAELAFILSQSHARALMVPSQWRSIDFVERVAAVRKEGYAGPVIVLGDREVAPPMLRWSGLAGVAADTAGPTIASDARCCLLYTSGTTSAPKGVIHSRSTILAESLGITAFFDTMGPLPMLVGAPAGHIGGIIAMVRPYLFGLRTGFLDRWDTDLAIRLIAEKRLAWCNAVPFHIRALIPAASRGQIPSFKLAIIGGASVPPSLIEDADAVGIHACRSYGSTEHPTSTYSTPVDGLRRRAYSDGRCRNGNEIRIVDDDGIDVERGLPGEVLTRGPERFAGYADETLDREAFTPDGWYRTGDVGVVDDEGFLSIVDRKKDIIIRGGENISSREVEDITTAHPAVAEAAAVAWPDAALGERVGIFVRLQPAANLTLDELRAHFQARGVSRQKCPEHVVVVADFPRNPSGKVLKTELRKQAKALAG